MGSPPDVIELPVIKGVGIMTLDQIRDAIEGNEPYDDVLIFALLPGIVAGSVARLLCDSFSVGWRWVDEK